MARACEFVERWLTPPQVHLHAQSVGRQLVVPLLPNASLFFERAA
jgi:hypothetical protein